MRVLVGPVEAVGLEPFAMGTISCAVASGQEAHHVEGGRAS